MLEFNTHASGGVTVNSASSMLSMLNMEASRHQNFLLGNPPLAALHSMAEPQSRKSCNPPQCSPTKPQTSKSSLATPHGINDILCRPVMTTAPSLGSLHGALPRFGLGAAAGMYFNPSGVHKLGLGDLQGRPHLYWPSVVQNQALWRERLASANLAQNCLMDKDGKKKQTRPTFSGHQIYVLEKTFEQTKYLAGPERAKLAYGLGMSEGQVKVWFQNRRTKWRKKHAAEMATAKKKHDSQSALHDDQVLLHGDPRGHREDDNGGSDQDDLDVLCKDYGGSREDSSSPMGMV